MEHGTNKFLFLIPSPPRAVRRVKHMAVLPTCMLGILLLFYGWMWAKGMDIEEAREKGWIGEAEPAGDWTETWKYIDFRSVRWDAMPQQFVTMVSMTLVVALSSCLDVAAIELELGKKLDYDHEVRRGLGGAGGGGFGQARRVTTR